MLAWPGGWRERVVAKVSAWSPLEHVLHLMLVNEAAFDRIDSLRAGAAGPGGGAVPPGAAGAGGPTWLGRLVLLTGWIPRGKGRAPESVRPAPESGVEAAQEALERSRVRFQGLAAAAGELEVIRGRARHFVFGELAAGEWLRFARIHSRHHLKIVVDIRRLAERSNPGPLR